MADYTSLKNKAQQIRDEVRIGANTASRVGHVMVETVNALEKDSTQIEQINIEIDALQAPAPPLYLEGNRIKLRYGTGLLTQEGTLFVEGAGGNGEGAYSEGDGITISAGNVISVRIGTGIIIGEGNNLMVDLSAIANV